MYASNEQEFNSEEKDWVFLPSSTPTTDFVPQPMQLLDNDDDDDSSSTSGSSISSGSMTNLCESLHRPSISSIESNTTSRCEESQTELATANAIIQTDRTTDENVLSMSTDEIKEETCSAGEELPTSNAIESSPVINEYDLSPIDIDSNVQSVSNELRRRTGAPTDQDEEEIPETMSISTDPSLSTLDMDYRSSNRSNEGFALKLLIIFFLLTPFFLGPFLQSEQPGLNITPPTNQHENAVTLSEIEQKLTQQIEEKFRILSNEKSMLLSQINDLYHLLNFTQESALNHINQLTDENKQLKEEIFALKHRLEEHEKASSDGKERRGCPRGSTARLNASKSPLETLLSNVIQRTVSVTTNHSVTFSSLFDQLTSSLNELVNRTAEHVKEKKQRSPVRQQAENVSYNARQTKPNYLTWTRARAELRERARTETSENDEKVSRRPWRWTFQRSDDRERLRHQPMTTKKWTGKKDRVCHSKFDFPRKQWCSVKYWLNKHIRP